MKRLALALLVACGGGGAGGVGVDGAVAVVADARPDALTRVAPVVVYVGDNGNHIHVFGLDRASLALAPMGSVATGSGPTFLAIDPAARFLVAVNERGDKIESFAVDARSGALTRRNAVASGGGGPAHVSLDRTGSWALVANYDGGTVEAVSVAADGTLGTPLPALAPGAKAHEILVDGSNGAAYVPCLGANLVAVYGFAVASGALTARSVTPNAGGPRHLALAPDGKHAWVVNETASTVTAYGVGAQGALAALGSVSTLPAGFSGANTGAEIAVHPSGAFVYASNRGHDSIASFAVGGDGRLTLLGHVKTGGGRPRHFSLALGGTALLVANQDGGTIHGFRVDGGTLTPVGELAKVAAPMFVGALELP